MNKLLRLEAKYAGGGRVSTPHALSAVRRAIAHVERGDHAAAHAELMRSPDARNHPQVQAAMRMLAPPTAMGSYDEGGEVRPTGSSSPGSPGVLGAIHDAVNSLKDYLIDRPRREMQAQRMASEDAYVNHGEQGYAEGGKVNAAKAMASFLQDKMGFSAEHAQKMADQYHNTVQASPAAKALADQATARVAPAARQKKAPQQLAQELSAGFVDPADLNHLMYTDPELTKLINRYQSGVDNQTLSAQTKQALASKLQALGGTAPPQLPQRTMQGPPGLPQTAPPSPPQMPGPPAMPGQPAPGAQMLPLGGGGGPPMQ